MEIIPYKIYTDGSQKGNGRENMFGGWGFIISYDGNIIHQGSGAEQGATNQRMELQAVIEGIRNAQAYTKNRPSATYEIYSDSAYIINCYNDKWYVNWEKNGWRNSKKEDVRNADQWAQIIPYFKNKRYTFHKVKGHTDNELNNKVDRLAQEAAEHLRLTGVG